MSNFFPVFRSCRRFSHSRIILASLAIAAVAILVPALTGADKAGAAPSLQGPVEPPSALNGKGLFEENCAPCHGQTGLGDGPTASSLPNGAPALADPALAGAASMQEWFEITKEGRMDLMMPPWKNRLDDTQIWDVVAYAYSLHVPEASIDQGEGIWNAQCSQCHGPLGAGDGPDAVAAGLQMPDLTDLGLATAVSDDQWMQVVSNGAGNMPAFSDTLSQDERLAAVQFARTFSYTPARTPALAAGGGRLVGRIVNNTAGGQAPTDALVTLFPFENFEDRRSLQTTSGPDGAFTFEGLPTGSEYAYILTTDYEGLPFGSDVVSFPTDTLEVDVTVPVWETSSTAQDIRISLAQLFIEPHQGNLLVGELYRITESGDRVYTGSEPAAAGRNAVLEFPVPAEATSLVLDGGEIGDRFVRTNTSVIDTQPLYPGTKQILMRYLLPYQGSTADIERPMAYPVDNLSVLVVDGPRVETDLQQGDPQTIQEQQWNNFVASDVPAGEEISLRLSGLERATAATAASAPSSPALSNAVLAYHPPIVVGVALLMGILAVALFILYALRSRPEPAAVVAAPASPAATPVAARQRQDLLQSIARLDDMYTSGEIEEDQYNKLRAAEKRRLVQLSEPAADTYTVADEAPAGATAGPEQPDA